LGGKAIAGTDTAVRDLDNATVSLTDTAEHNFADSEYGSSTAGVKNSFSSVYNSNISTSGST